MDTIISLTLSLQNFSTNAKLDYLEILSQASNENSLGLPLFYLLFPTLFQTQTNITGSCKSSYDYDFISKYNF